MNRQMSMKKKVFWGSIALAAVFSLICGSLIVETVKKGTYQIRQMAFSGGMSAKMTPGIWMQVFSDMGTWPKAETFFFIADKEEGEKIDQSIEVRFNDGSICNISGTMRILMPTSEQQAIKLVTDLGYATYRDLEAKLLLPTVRNALRLTANFMTARESYSEQRPEFVNWSWDQIQNGLYETKKETRKILDVLSGDSITKTFKVPREDSTGTRFYQKNPLKGTGIRLANFEIKQFVYKGKVNEQIEKQQEAFMAVATAKADAEKAEQESITEEAQGKKRVMTAKYKEEEAKVTAVVKAEQKRDVAKLEKEAAVFTKQKEILLGQGEAERKKLVMFADGALKQKLDTYEKVMATWADAYSKRAVPHMIMGGGGSGTDGQTMDFQQSMNLLVAGQLGLDMSMPKK